MQERKVTCEAGREIELDCFEYPTSAEWHIVSVDGSSLTHSNNLGDISGSERDAIVKNCGRCKEKPERACDLSEVIIAKTWMKWHDKVKRELGREMTPREYNDEWCKFIGLAREEAHISEDLTEMNRQLIASLDHSSCDFELVMAPPKVV